MNLIHGLRKQIFQVIEWLYYVAVTISILIGYSTSIQLILAGTIFCFVIARDKTPFTCKSVDILSTTVLIQDELSS